MLSFQIKWFMPLIINFEHNTKMTIGYFMAPLSNEMKTWWIVCGQGGAGVWFQLILTVLWYKMVILTWVWKPNDLSNLFSSLWHNPSQPNAPASNILSWICLESVSCFWYTLMASSTLFILIRMSPMLASALNLAWLCLDTWAMAETKYSDQKNVAMQMCNKWHPSCLHA